MPSLPIPCPVVVRLRSLILVALAILLAAALDPSAVQAQAFSLAADASSVPVRTTLHLTATASAGATGSVTFYDGTTQLATRSLTVAAKAVYASAVLTAGNHTFSATYSGDRLHSAATSPPVPVVVTTILPPPFTVSANHSTTFTTQPLVATSLGLPPDASGSVTFYDNNTPVGSTVITRVSGPAYLSLGDDIPAGATLVTPALAFPTLLAAEHGYTLTSQAVAGQSACDILLQQLVRPSIDFTQTGAPLTTLMPGVNDTAFPTSEPVFRLCHQAALAWLAIPREFKVLAGDAAAVALSGTWNVSPDLSVLYNGTNSGSAQFSITSTGAPIYVWYLLDQKVPGLFNITVDGVPDPTLYNAQPAAGINTASGLGLALLRIPVPAGAHVIQFTLQTGALGILGIGTPPAAGDGSLHPTVLVSDLPAENQAAPRDPASTTDLFSADIQANVALLAADGLDLRLVTTRNWMHGAPEAMSDQVHPNPLGHTQLTAAFDSMLGTIAPAAITTFVPSTQTASLMLQTPGARQLTAIYSGDAVYSPAISTPYAVTVQDGSTSITLTTPALSVPYHASIPLTATVSPADAFGTVTFLANGSIFTTSQLVAGTATAVQDFGTGPVSLTATFNPYDGRAPVTSPPVVVNVGRQNATLSLIAQQQGPFQTQGQNQSQPSLPSAVLTAYVNPVTATGSITFTEPQSGFTATTPLVNGAAFLPVPNLTAGTHNYTATYSGDAVYAPLTSAPAALTPGAVTPSLIATLLTNPASPAGATASIHVDALAQGVPLAPFVPTSFPKALNLSTAFMGDSITQWWPMPLNDRGIAGQTTTQMVGRFESDVLNQGFSRVVILGGTNDTIQGIDPAITLANLTTMAQQAASGGLRPILATIPPLFNSQGYFSAQVFSLNTSIRELAQRNGLLLLDYYAALVQHPEFFRDGIHPNPDGYTAMETVLAQTLLVPTGNVTLSDGSSASLSSFGTATLTSAPVPGGPQSYTVSHAGDANFAPASAIIQTNFVQAASAITLSVQPLDGYAGNAVAFTAAVVGPLDLGASGTITFFDNGRPTGSATLTGQQPATYTASNLTPGAHAFTAAYAGDNSFTASVSPAITLTSPFSNTSLALSTAAPTAVAGAPVILTATLTPASAGGSITFLDGNVILAQQPLAAGQATFTTSTLAVGTHALTVLYAGDPNDSIAASPVLAVTIKPSPTTLILAGLAVTQIVDTPVSVTASITPVTATGQVTWLDSYTAPNQPQATIQTLGQTSLHAGLATLNLATLPVGNHVLSAAYAGDTSNLAAVSAPMSTIVSPLTATLVLSSPQTSLAYLTPATLAVTVSPATATGSVFLRDSSGTQVGQAQLANAAVTFTLPNLSIGLHSFTAAYAGDLNDSAASSLPLTLTITPAPSTLTLAQPPGQIAAGAPVTLSVTIAPAAASGSVTFRDAVAGTLGQATLASGSATLTLPSLPVGAYTLSAAYAGDPQDAPSLSNTASLKVALNPTVTTLASLPAQLAQGAPLTLTATVIPGTSTASVSFFDGPNSLGTALLLNGVATLQLATLPTGTHTLHAAFAGDTLLASSSSAPATVVVAANATSTTLTLAQLTVTDGDLITVNIHVAGSSATAPTGTIFLRSTTGTIASGSLSHGQGSDAFTTLTLASTLLGPGTFPLTALYAGDPANAASDSSASPLAITIVRAATTLTLVTDATVLPVQTPVQIAVTLTGPSPAQIPTGTVTFLLNGAPILTLPVDPTGKASATLPGQPVGSDTLSAAYTPTGIFASSTTPPQTLTYTPPVSLTFPVDTLTMTPASHANTNLIITPLSGFTGAIAAQCSTSKPFITCTLDAPSSVAGPSVAAVHLAVANATGPTGKHIPAPVAFTLLLLLPFASRRSRLRLPLLLLALVAAAGNLTGCASADNFNTIPSGYQFVTVTVTAGQTTAQASLNIQISA